MSRQYIICTCVQGSSCHAFIWLNLMANLEFWFRRGNMHCHFTLMNKLNVKRNGNMFGIRVVCAECFMLWHGCTRVLWKVLGLTMKKEFIISKLFLIFIIISLKTNTFIPAMLQHHYPVPIVVLRKICKIPLYSCNRLLVRRKTLTSEEEFEFWEETEVKGSQICGTGWMFQQLIVQIP